MSRTATQAYKGNGKHDWEFTTEDSAHVTERLRVPGGWLYRIWNIESAGSDAMVFVPMPEVVKHKV